MGTRLQAEIKQKKPFVSLEEEAYLNLVRTADTLTREIELMVQPHGITPTQYNVLRILRGAGEEGATCTAISERLLAFDPDVTRLLDRLEKSGLVIRARSLTDRRVVMTNITPAGLAVLSALDAPLKALLRRQFRAIPREHLTRFIEDLEQLRER